MSKAATKSSLVLIAFVLLAIGLAIAAYVYLSTTKVREALAEEIIEQQHDVADLIQQYGNVLITIEQKRLATNETSKANLDSAVNSALEQLEVMRSNYSFEQLDGAANAHTYVKPIIEDISQWTNEGIHGFAPDHPFVLEHASKRLRDRFPEVRTISSDTNTVADALISEQTDFLEKFRDSLLWLLFGFVLLSVAIAALLIRQRNLQTQLAIDQDTSAQKVIDAETRGRLQAESALAGSEQFLMATLNSLHADIAILDDSGVIKAVNKPWMTFVRANDSKFVDGGVGLHYVDVFQSTATSNSELIGVNEVIRQVDKVLANDAEVMFHEYPCQRDKKRQWSLVTMYTFYTDDGRHSVFVHEDVSTRKQLEERDFLLRSELAHASRLTTAGELASGLAHELNQPLTAITHNCDAVISSVRNATDIDHDLEETVNDISEQAQRAGSIIRSMRHLVRKDNSDKRATNVNELVQETVRLTAPEAREKGVDVHLNLAEALPQPEIDPVQIQQVLVNLERNGVEAMWQADSPLKELTIQTMLNDNGNIQVCVSDTGPGVDADFANGLFTPFLTTKPEGMGLGLSISRTIVEDHGGRLWIDPDAEDATVFKFTIPSEHHV